MSLVRCIPAAILRVVPRSAAVRRLQSAPFVCSRHCRPDCCSNGLCASRARRQQHRAGTHSSNCAVHGWCPPASLLVPVVSDWRGRHSNMQQLSMDGGGADSRARSGHWSGVRALQAIRGPLGCLRCACARARLWLCASVRRDECVCARRAFAFRLRWEGCARARVLVHARERVCSHSRACAHLRAGPRMHAVASACMLASVYAHAHEQRVCVHTHECVRVCMHAHERAESERAGSREGMSASAGL